MRRLFGEVALMRMGARSSWPQGTRAVLPTFVLFSGWHDWDT